MPGASRPQVARVRHLRRHLRLRLRRHRRPTDDWAASVTGNGRAPLRPGENLPPPTKIVDVQPAYPEIAQSARVQGVVVIDAVIDESGSVSAARVARSIPLLDQAALDAVRQWKFTPTLLNGAPVPVVVTMTINFTLR